MIVKIIVLAFIILFLDIIYLTSLSNHYNNTVTTIQGSPLKLKYIPAILCYIFIIFQLYYFIIKNNMSTFDAFLLGMTTYGIFDLTNMAIFDNWDIVSVTIDTIWGGTLYGLTTFLFTRIF